MPVTVKCRCGKNEKHFQRLNAGDIDCFECDQCSEMDEQSKNSEQPPVETETPAQKKAREKAEKKAKEAADKAAKENKPE